MTIDEIKEANQALKKKIQDAMLHHQLLTGCQAEVRMDWMSIGNSFRNGSSIPIVDVTIKIK